MSNTERLLVAANPAPNDAELPVGMWDAERTLLTIDARSGDMRTEDRLIEKPGAPTRLRRMRPALVALAAFVVVVIVGIGIAVVSGGGGGSTVPPVTPSVTSTTAVTTTSASTTEAPATTSALDVVENWWDRYLDGDVAGWEGLLADGAQWTGPCPAGTCSVVYAGSQLEGDLGRDSVWAAVGGLETSHECTEPEDGQVVCRVSFARGGVDIYSLVTTHTVADGAIARWTYRDIPVGSAGIFLVAADAEFIGEYRLWLRDTDGEAFDRLFFLGETARLDPEFVDEHRTFVAQFLGS